MPDILRAKRALILSATAMAIVATTVQSATAQTARSLETPGDITVVGRAEETLPQEPRSVTRIDRDTIVQAGVDTIRDIKALVPNVYLADQGSPRFSINTMRGIGNTIRNDYFNSTIGLYVDGVPMPSAEFSRRLVDVDSIEVLRGPAGTAQGRFSLGGSIYVHSRQPTNELRASVEGTLGSVEQREAGASISGPLVRDRLFARAYVDYAARDGFIYDATGRDIDFRKTVSGGGSLRFQPGSDLSVTIAGDYQRDHVGAYAFLPYDRYQTRKLAVRPPNEELRRGGGASATIDYDMGGARLSAITGWRDYSVRARQDLAYSPPAVQYGGGRTDSNEHGWQVSQEVKLTSRDPVPGSIRWTAGGYYQRDRVTYDYIFDFPAFGPPGRYLSYYDREEIAGFGEATVPLVARVELTGGMRIAHDRDTLRTNSRFDGRTDATLVTPRVQLAWRPDADRMIYLSATKGARSGGFSRLASNPNAFGAEYLWQYEAGLRSSWLDHRLGVNLAVFRIDWRDQQITQLTAANQSRTTNAGRSHSEGAELEAVLYPVSGLELSGRGGLTDARYDRYVNTRGVDLAGKRMVNTPASTVGASAQYRWPVGRAVLLLRGDYERVGAQYFDPENRLRQGAYDLVNARLGIEQGRFSASLFVRNLFDRRYRAYGFTDSFGYDTAIVGMRRLIGVTGKVAFR